MEKVICVLGPTASGKTALAVDLATRLGGEVVSCDSMQIYRGLDIGTAKPTAEEMGGIPHHMLSVADPNDKYSVARYVEEAAVCIDDILSRGRVPIIAGGTGLYMDSLMRGLYFSNAPEDGILRKRLETMHDRFGGERMYKLLQARDPAAAAKLHPNDKRRICRALEVLFCGGPTISQHNAVTESIQPRFSGLYIGLDYKDRSLLHERIGRRVDRMFERGLIEEVQRLLPLLNPESGAYQAIGYKELIERMELGEDPLSAAEDIKTATRRYAKRQLTWFRRNRSVNWFYRDLEKDSEILEISSKYSRDHLYNSP